MPVSTGVAAALAAPLLEAVGFLEWDIHWSKHGGSAFALNLYKCNFAAFFFLCMVILENNLPYLVATIHNGKELHTPFAEGALGNNQNSDIQDYNIIREVPGSESNFYNNDLSVLHVQNPNQMSGQFPNTMNMQNYNYGMSVQQYPLDQSLQQIGSSMQQQQQQTPNYPMNNGNNGIQPIYPPQHETTAQEPNNPQNRLLQAMMGQQQYFDQQGLPISNYNNFVQQDVPETYHHPFAGQYHKLPYLLLSSLLDIIIGDLAELEALRLIGARRILMVYTIKPFAAAIIGNVLLHEPIYAAAFIGMILTALGVYFVLIASLEKFEKKRRKRNRRSMKRTIFGGTTSDDDRSFDTGSIGSFNEDEEIAGILNSDYSSSTSYNYGVDNIRMIGMTRRSLSRYDLTSDYFDDGDFPDEDDDFGRGVIDTTISCIKPASSYGSNDGWENYSSDNRSFGHQSFDSMTSLEKLDADMMDAMEHFDSDDDIDDMNDYNNDQNPMSPKMLMDTKSNAIPKESDTKIFLSTTTSEKPLKSALRQSKYGGTQSLSPPSNTSNNNHNGNENASPFTKKVFETLPPITKKRDLVMSRGRSSDSVGSIASMGSMASFESECGPPPGMYAHSRKENKVERKVRLRTGYVLATFNVILDAYCSYLMKKHGGGLSTWEINLCRLGFAGLILSLIAAIMKHRERLRSGRHADDAYFRPISNESQKKFRPWYRLPKMAVYPWIIVSMGVFFVTFLSPALANYSLFQIPLALSISLTSITPLFTIPLGILRKGERPTFRGYVGVTLSVMGVMILCIWGLDSSTM